MRTCDLRVEQRGGTQREAKMALAHEQKVEAVGHMIFSSHIPNILTQALLLKYDIVDCLIVINLIDAPQTVDVKLASVFLSENVTCTYYKDSAPVKRFIEQNRKAEALTVLVLALEKTVVTSFQGKNSPCGSWRQTQAVVRRDEEDEAKHLWCNPDELERRLQVLRVANSRFD
jgi:hypothetical protein